MVVLGDQDVLRNFYCDLQFNPIAVASRDHRYFFANHATAIQSIIIVAI